MSLVSANRTCFTCSRALCLGPAVVFLVGTIIALAGEARGQRAGGTLRILVTGNLRGVFEPCGCQPLQAGGISRRSTLLKDLRRGHNRLLLVDLGDNHGRAAALPAATEFLRSHFQAEGYDAALTGTAGQASAPSSAPAAATSAFLYTRPDAGFVGNDTRNPWCAVRMGGVIAVLVACVRDEREAEGQMAAALAKTVQSARKAVPGVALVVGLAQLPPAVLEKTAAAAPGVDLWLSGRHDGDVQRMRRIGRSWLVPTSLYGHSVTVLDVTLGAGGGVERAVHARMPVNASIARDARVEKRVREFLTTHMSLDPRLEQLRETDSRLREALGAQEAAGEACGSCHRSAQAAWSTTGHARAWQTLIREKASTRRDCVGCHTTPQASVAALSDGLSGVGCTACHGGDPRHARQPARTDLIVRRPSVEVCRSCHHPPEDPAFRYAPALARIACNRGR